jgi:putative DNA primase/helicase
MSTAEHFRAALRAAGIEHAGELMADGRLHRFKTTGDRERNSWYVLHSGVPTAGAFGCWKRGFKETWCEQRRENFTDAEWQAIREKWKRAEAERERAESERHAKARKTAAWIFDRARPLTAHVYLDAKGVKPFGGVRERSGALVLPLCDAGGELHSLQFIGADGTKRFLIGGRCAGCFFMLADKPDVASNYSRTRTVPDHGVCALTEKLRTRMRSWTGHGLPVTTDIGAAICRSDRGFTASIARTQNPRFYEG